MSNTQQCHSTAQLGPPLPSSPTLHYKLPQCLGPNPGPLDVENEESLNPPHEDHAAVCIGGVSLAVTPYQVPRATRPQSICGIMSTDSKPCSTPLFPDNGGKVVDNRLLGGIRMNKANKQHT